MRFGLLADIHGDIEKLSQAIEQLRHQSVQQYVVLGDVIYDTCCADETVALLQSCAAIGVWGNHELGLCVDPEDDVRAMYSDTVMEYFCTLQPRLLCGDVLVSHTFPTQDAREVLSYYFGQPEDAAIVADCFKRFLNRIMIVGHFHRWLAATPSGRLDWNGECTLRLEPNERYFIVIDAVIDGFAAVLDDVQNVLIPINLLS
ncbi:MAG: metallophosphoesterase family protein [Planctomycetales bacterium]|nr:metallophosphoesterase family protein [Planctomycetales bacterium]